MGLLGHDINPLIGFGRGQSTDGIAGGNAQRAVQQGGCRGVVAADAFMIFIQESDDHIASFVHGRVIVQVVIGGLLNVAGNFLDDSGGVFGKTVGLDDGIHVGHGFFVNGQIIFIHKLAITRFKGVVDVGTGHGGGGSVVVFHTVAFPYGTYIEGVICLDDIFALGAHVIGQGIVVDIGDDLNSVGGNIQFFQIERG